MSDTSLTEPPARSLNNRSKGMKNPPIVPIGVPKYEFRTVETISARFVAASTTTRLAHLPFKARRLGHREGWASAIDGSPEMIRAVKAKPIVLDMRLPLLELNAPDNRRRPPGIVQL